MSRYAFSCPDRKTGECDRWGEARWQLERLAEKVEISMGAGLDEMLIGIEWCWAVSLVKAGLRYGEVFTIARNCIWRTDLALRKLNCGSILDAW